MGKKTKNNKEKNGMKITNIIYAGENQRKHQITYFPLNSVLVYT